MYKRQVYGRDMAKALLEVSYENDFMKIEGYAGKPEAVSYTHLDVYKRQV